MAVRRVKKVDLKRIGTSFNEIFQTKIINTSGKKNDIGTTGNDLLDPLLGDVCFFLSDCLQLLRIVNNYLHTKMHLGFHYAKIKQCNFCTNNLLGHSLTGDGTVKGISIDRDGFLHVATM